ncbi:MAG TPA: TetR/AcrR family transcriptional regulator [Solirubrobacterales bacterium]|nr:TetR/AcrR family transcriptional regulator [Solirubrobacterales bacterium]
MGPSVLRSVHLGSGRRLTGLGLSPEQVAFDQRRRIHAGLEAAVARRGYLRTTVRHIIEPAGVSRRTFYELYPGKQGAFLAAHEGALAELTERVSVATGSLPWRRAVEAAIAAALAFAAASPERALLLAGDGFAVGPWAAYAHDALLARFGPSLGLGRALSSTAKPPTLEAALIGGIAGVVADRLRTGRSRELRGLDARLTEFALAPYVGLEAALSASRGENFAAESLK